MATIQSVKISMGWQSALQRPQCSRCRHGEQRTPEGYRDAITWHCVLGGFMTGAYAFCNQYEARK